VENRGGDLEHARTTGRWCVRLGKRDPRLDMHVVHVPRGLREYRREYGLVSGTCSSVQFDAALIPARCSPFQLVALRCECTGETLNPKVEGSNPSRPIQNWLQNTTFVGKLGLMILTGAFSRS